MISDTPIVRGDGTPPVLAPTVEPSAAQRIFDAVQPFIFQQDEDEVRALIETALGVEK